MIGFVKGYPECFQDSPVEFTSVKFELDKLEFKSRNRNMYAPRTVRRAPLKPSPQVRDQLEGEAK